MDWIALCVICMNIVILQARHDNNIKKLIQKIKRRNSLQASPILGAPEYPAHLPEAEPILPGHTLLRPAKGMLKSAIKYPLRDTGSLVYGNAANIGIADDENQRVMYSSFRKSTDLQTALQNAIRDLLKKKGNSQRRFSKHHLSPILGVPRYPEDLPEAEPILPGHTLLRPSRGMLKSAIKFPHTHTGGSLVYGHKDNIGISNEKHEQLLYTDFRKSNLLTAIANSILEYKQKHTRPEIALPLAAFMSYKKKKSILDNVVTHTDEENNAREIIDDLDPERNFFDEEDISEVDFRRKRKMKSKYRHRSAESYKNVSRSSENSDSETDTLTLSESESVSSSHERNPGNPYTIHKNKYKQNFMWNHNMDGDHMNINPYAPFFKESGPSGADLMFGRKWWYFNQDDYKPMG